MTDITGRPRLTSRIPGFYERPLDERVSFLERTELLGEASLAHLRRGGGLPLSVADRMSENVVATHGLPLGIALNFRIDGRDVLVPMAVEEPSVIAAASNAARLVRVSGGFRGEADPPIMTGQIAVHDVRDPEAARSRLDASRAALMAIGDAAVPRLCARGGGCRDVEVRIVDAESGLLVVHVYLDVGDAMGANLVDAVAEAVAPRIADIAGGVVGLRILTNLPTRRRVRVRADVSAEAVSGPALADGIARASRFAELDPFRAVTHNKGIMNGVDAVAIATGQDFRAIEAGAHAWAARDGRYGPLATWRRTPEGLAGLIELPLAVGIVGGSTATPGARAALELLSVSSAGDLGIVMAAAGLASNLAALRALAGEGIQRGHMRLHARKHVEDHGPLRGSDDVAASGGRS